MKKFDMKKLTILLLSFVLVFALVACNREGGGGGGGTTTNVPEEIRTSDYFNKLIASTKSVSPDAGIQADDNLYINLGLGVKLDMVKNNITDVVSSVNVGIRAEIVLDRKSEKGEHSAAKVTLYNRSTSENWLTAYYFLDDSANIYVDFDGQKLKVPFDTGFNTESSTKYAEEFKKFFEKNLENTDFSIADIIGGLAMGGGENWSLNNLVQNVISAIGMEDKVGGFFDSATASTVLGLLKLTKDDLLTPEGKLTIENALKSESLQSLAFKSATETKLDNGASLYSIALNWETISALLPIIINDQALVDGITSILDNNTDIRLQYEADEQNDLKSFTISAKLESLKSKVKSYYVRPNISITIDKFQFSKAGELTDETSSATKLGVNKTDFSNEVTLNASMKLNANGITLNAGDKAYKMDGEFVLDLNARIDLAGKGEQNKSQLYATLKKAGVDTPIATLSYGYDSAKKSGTLVLAVDSSVKSGDSSFSYIEALINSFGQDIIDAFGKNTTIADALQAVFFKEDGTYNTDFKGVAITDIDLVKLIYSATEYNPPVVTPPAEEAVSAADAVMSVFDGYFQRKDASGTNVWINASDDSYKLSANIKNALKAIVEMFGTDADGNKITLGANEIISKIFSILKVESATVYKNVDGSFVADGTSQIHSEALKDKTELMKRLFVYDQPIIKAFTDLGIIAPYTENEISYYKTPYMLTDAEVTLIWDYMCQTKKYSDYKTLAGDAAASEVAFNSVITACIPAQVYNLLKGSSFIGASDTYGKVMETVSKAGLSVTLDMSSGFAFGAKLTVGDSSLEVSFALNAKAYSADDFKTVQVPSDDTTGWAILKA